MNKYEGMFILKPDLTEEERKVIFAHIAEAITKNNGQVAEAAVWAEKKKLCFPIKKQQEGLYYLVNFSAPPASIKDVKQAYTLNENILRVLITA